MSSASQHDFSSALNYEVVLSFHGKDVRTGFADHLYHALVGARIRTFRDDEELKEGEEIDPNLLASIQQSRISIPIFSVNYASSKWCLNELKEISECKKTRGQTVLPIFYKIEPTNVRNQTGEYAKAFADEHSKHLDQTMVTKWREALQEIGKLKGVHLKEDMYETELIKKIVKTVSSKFYITEVFLSFHGKDVRTGFVDHLYHALVGAGIRTFRDDEELKKGEEMASNLFKAVQQSTISIPILSTNYASSKWCLNELKEISECKKTRNQTVLPIFYKIEPTNVRNQTGEYEEAFEEHLQRFDQETVKQWRDALKETGKLDGWHLKEGMYEAESIKEIVKTVSIKLNMRLVK